MLINYLILFLKGLGMGAANVIPGVSGGTIAFITGIFERIINAIKSFNLTALRLLYQRRFKDLVEHLDLWFLISVGLGVLVSIFSLAKLLEFLFQAYPVHVWSYFFGLILASVYFVGKTIEKWTTSVVILFIAGIGFALMFTFSSPLQENNSLWYNILCGAISACSMILPGLSGSFVLLLMGNYHLIMIQSISNLDFNVLIPVGIGAIAGLVLFSYFLSWIFKRFKDQTISLLTGFILGSLAIIWPWKTVVKTYVDRQGTLRPLIQKNVLPAEYALETHNNSHLTAAIILIAIGILTIIFIEWQASKKQTT
ncbi:MAG TPA: DUF368 domain-containing protein [Salinivirgaceae bacterium]|nr:DUF368 domain-containing protein [Salinivirgaceae bacterium]